MAPKRPKAPRPLAQLNEDDLRRMLEDVAERIASRLERQIPKTLNSAEAARMLSKTPAAFKQFLLRHPDFPRDKAGKRLLFDPVRVKAWMEKTRSKRRGPS